jgi:predicted RNA-binding protein YlxR (DUF448 family)
MNAMLENPAETTAFDETPETGPNRRCIASGESRPIAQLVRFVVGPDDTIFPDVDQRLPGRGLWLSADRAMIETATSKRLFSKAARQNVHASADLADTVADLLKRRCLNHLGLARRAGLVVAGAEKVRAQLSSGRTAVLLEAADGSLPERIKITALAPTLPVVDLFTGSELGAALGRDAAVHVALLPGRLTAMLVEDAGRYAGVRRSEDATNRSHKVS